jgi:hypothetical protein
VGSLSRGTVEAFGYNRFFVAPAAIGAPIIALSLTI